MTLGYLECSLLLLLFSVYAEEVPELKIDDCTIVGKWDNYGTNVAQFHSIPFIQPPIGPLRWKPPLRVVNYSDTSNVCQNTEQLLNATYHHSRCSQPWRNYPDGPWPPQSEDCVHLDIYSPSFQTDASLPVYIYYHGGSSFSGGNFQYDFTNFSIAQQGVVVVPNYRLGLLGFLSLEALTQESDTKCSGNYGLMDCTEALKWVKQYISLFGGNPNDVTIFGQSTGGTIGLSMLAMPSSKGLFNRVISMSGSPNISMDLQTAEKQNEPLINALNCSHFENEKIMRCMRSIASSDITAAYPLRWLDADDRTAALPAPFKKGSDQAGLMIVDGCLVTKSVTNALHSGLIDVPLMLGTTQYESDWGPYKDVRNLTTKSEFGAFLDKHFMEWGAGFGVHLWKTYYDEEWLLGGAQLVYDAISADATVYCGNKYLATLAADSRHYDSNVYVFSVQQWPSHPLTSHSAQQRPATNGWNSTHSFHGIDFFAATFSWNAFEYWGALDYSPKYSDQGFGALLRDHWKRFVDKNEPLSIWKPYNHRYSTALIGNGVNKFTQYNATTIVQDYKSDVCKYYWDNNIGPTFWWSN